MRYVLALCTLVACKTPSSDSSVSADAGSPLAPLPTPSTSAASSSVAVIDSGVPAADAQTAPRVVDLRVPELREPLIACVASMVGPRLGIRGTFRMHVIVELGDGGTPQTWVEDDGRPKALARAGSCLEDWGRLVATTFPGAHGRHGVWVQGPFGGWVVTPD
jgi:hypothetical protein